LLGFESHGYWCQNSFNRYLQASLSNHCIRKRHRLADLRGIEQRWLRALQSDAADRFIDVRLRRMDNEIYMLAESIGRELSRRGQSVTVAESCTGGGLAHALTDVPGSSGWFGLGLVTYANSAKHRLLEVPLECLEGEQAPGAVSEPTVRHMATGALKASAADFAIATSGIAGPGGGSERKPVGTVWIAWACRGSRDNVEMRTSCQVYDGDREQIRRQAVITALGGLLEWLQEA